MNLMYLKLMWMKNKVVEGLKDESGMGVIEIALIIIVLIAIALIFRNEINDLVTRLTGEMKSLNVDQYK